MNIALLEKEVQKVRSQLDELNNQLLSLQEKISNTKNYLGGLEQGLKLLDRPIIFSKSKSNQLRPGCELAKIRDILFNSPEPMHVDEIVKALKDESPNKKASLVGSLNDYVKNKRIFIKVSPNTFTVMKNE